MDYLPVFLRVADKNVVVVGGGEVALRKAQWLLKAGARVRGVFALREATRRAPREWLMRYETTVEIEGADKPALVAQWLTMLVAAE